MSVGRPECRNRDASITIKLISLKGGHICTSLSHKQQVARSIATPQLHSPPFSLLHSPRNRVLRQQEYFHCVRCKSSQGSPESNRTPKSNPVYDHVRQEAKAAAMGPRRNGTLLSEVLAEPLLSVIRDQASQAQAAGWFWVYNLKHIKVRP